MSLRALVVALGALLRGWPGAGRFDAAGARAEVGEVGAGAALRRGLEGGADWREGGARGARVKGRDIRPPPGKRPQRPRLRGRKTR